MIHLRSLIRLRWFAVCAQAIMLGVLTLKFDLVPQWSVVVGLLGFEVLSNGVFHLVAKRQWPVQSWLVAGVMALDMVLLTGLLFASGGALNPFSFLYLVHLALASVTLQFGFSLGLSGVAAGCYALLFVLPAPHAGGHHHHHGQGAHHDVSALMLHLEGMWWAFTVTAVFLVVVIYDVRHRMKQQEEQLARAEQERGRQAKLASLGTLVAGAAHELATPLGTIALVAKELEHTLVNQGGGVDSMVLEDAQTIREEVGRCKTILSKLSHHAGEGVGEGFVWTSLAELVEHVLNDVGERARVRVMLRQEERLIKVRIPRGSLSQALRGAVRNALRADEAGVVVIQLGERTKSSVTLEVVDQGVGMSHDVQARAMEPFFSTKPEGQGMGLGLFLLHRVVAQLGGRVQLQSEEGQGTTVSVTIPTGPETMEHTS